jgi:hypothetical protein
MCAVFDGAHESGVVWHSSRVVGTFVKLIRRREARLGLCSDNMNRWPSL